MKVTAKFVGQDGNALTATFDQATQTVTDETGRTGKFTRADGANVIQITGDDTLTLTINGEMKFEPGYSTTYSSSNGRSGTVTIISVG